MRAASARAEPHTDAPRALLHYARGRGAGDVDAGLVEICAEQLARDHADDLLTARDKVMLPQLRAALAIECAQADDVQQRASSLAVRAALRAGELLEERAAIAASASSTKKAAAEEPPPLDLFGDATLAGSPDLPRDTLPSVIAAYATDEAERLGVDVAMLALPAIVVCAAAIDDAFVLQPKTHDTEWIERPCLWLGVVAEIGHHKTPALQKATAPLRAAEKRWLQEDREALAAWKKDHDEGEERPAQRRLIVDNTTIEALSDILVDNPRGVLCVRDELSAWYGSFNQYRDGGSGSDRGLWIESYNGGPKPIDRVKRGNIYVPNWSVCLLGGIQPGPMRRLAHKTDDDGLLQRFITIFPKSVAEGVDRKPDYAALTRYHETVVHLVDLVPTRSRVVFRLSREAQNERVIVDRLARNVMLLPETSAAFRGHLAKWGGLFARLLCTFHVVEAVADGVQPADVVTGTTAARVARLMTEYLLPHAARFYTELLGQEHLTHARWIAGRTRPPTGADLRPRRRARVPRSAWRWKPRCRSHVDARTRRMGQ